MLCNIIEGSRLAREWQTTLNEICLQDQGIEQDDEARIWNKIHGLAGHNKITLQQWFDWVSALTTQGMKTPGLLTSQDIDFLQQVVATLTECEKTGKDFAGAPKISKSGHKRKVWMLLMRTREILNRLDGQTILNRPKSKYGDLNT